MESQRGYNLHKVPPRPRTRKTQGAVRATLSKDPAIFVLVACDVSDVLHMKIARRQRQKETTIKSKSQRTKNPQGKGNNTLLLSRPLVLVFRA